VSNSIFNVANLLIMMMCGCLYMFWEGFYGSNSKNTPLDTTRYFPRNRLLWLSDIVF